MESIALALLSAAGIGATTTAVAVTTAIVGAAFSIGTSLLAQFLTPKPEARPTDRQNTVKLSIAPRARHYGRVRIGGALAFEAASGGVLHRVTAHADGEIDAIEQHLIDDVEVTVEPDFSVSSPSTYEGLVTIETRTGTSAPAWYGRLGAVMPEWTDDHTGAGVATSYVTMKQVKQERYLDVYPKGINTSYKQTLRGARIWDPRVATQRPGDPSTWGWSDNAILVALDHVRHESGLGIPDEWVMPELDAWKAAADIADQLVPLKYGGTERRYRASGSYSYDERPADVLQRIMAASNSRLWIGGNGGITCAPGIWQPPSITIGDDAIEAYQIGAGNEGPDVVNTLVGIYTDPERDYTETQSEAWTDAGSVATYGPKRSQAQLYMVPSNAQCRRLMKQAMAELSPRWRGRITTNLRGLPALSERYIRIVISELGLDFTAEIDDAQFIIERGTIVRGLTIDFISIDETAFAWNAADDEGERYPPPPSLSTSAVPAVASFAVLTETRVIDGVSTFVAVASWGAYAVEGYWAAVEYRALGSLTWLLGPTPADDATSIEIPGLVDGTAYEFRARTTSGARTSAYTATITLTA